MILCPLLVVSFFVSLTFAANWKYEIYVSSSFGVSTTSCWNGGDQTPCVTLNLALQGLQHNSTVIYLYPGIYILDNISKVIDKSNVAIIGITTKDGGMTVTIKCSSYSGLLFLSSTNIILESLVLDSCGNIQINPNREFDFQLSAVYISMCYNVQLIDIVIESGNYSTGLNDCSYNEHSNGIDCKESLECPYLVIEKISYGITAYSGDPFYVSASVYDCYNVSYEWKNDLQACIISGPAFFDNNLYQQCTTITYDHHYYITLYYNITLDNVTDSSEVILLIQTQWPIVLQSNISVMLKKHMHQHFCYIDSRKGACALGYGVPINQLNRCVQCDQYPLPDWIIFVLIQLLPVTIVVLIIIVFNIQLTNGFMNGLIFYSQMISIVYPNLSLNIASRIYYGYYYNIYCSPYYPNLYVIPGNLFNLNFVMFVVKPLCITSNMTLLQAILFWYIIPTYPLVLLLLIYTWITMYDKGFRYVVTITRPLHRLLARFWRKTKMEPCLIHSIASIYLLCFTQFAATSLQLLYPTTWYYENESGIAFYDGTLKYFGWPHSFAGIFAIIVLLFIIFLPMLYIQLYPFKLFHKLLSCIHLRKEILISLGDVFTGPYKDGSKNTRDYRYYAGFYFFLRIIVLCLYFAPSDIYIPQNDSTFYRIIFPQMALFTVFGGTNAIFRPYKRNIHSFFDFFFMLVLSIVTVVGYSNIINLLLLLIVLGIIVYWTIKKIWICCQSCKANRKHNTPNNEEDEDMEYILVDDDNWDADRMEHPDDYDEHHVQYVPYDLTVSQPEENTVHATYDNTRSAEINNFEIGSPSESDTWSILGSSNTIPLHSIVSTTQESSISNVNDEDEV